MHEADGMSCLVAGDRATVDTVAVRRNDAHVGLITFVQCPIDKVIAPGDADEVPWDGQIAFLFLEDDVGLAAPRETGLVSCVRDRSVGTYSFRSIVCSASRSLASSSPGSPLSAYQYQLALSVRQTRIFPQRARRGPNIANCSCLWAPCRHSCDWLELVPMTPRAP